MKKKKKRKVMLKTVKKTRSNKSIKNKMTSK